MFIKLQSVWRKLGTESELVRVMYVRTNDDEKRQVTMARMTWPGGTEIIDREEFEAKYTPHEPKTSNVVDRKSVV